MNKSLITDIVSIALIGVSLVFEGEVAKVLLYMGLFALSGAVTNQLAIHMLFERVPFLYGSGVIELRFEAFKNSIRDLMMREFFTKEQLDNFFKQEEAKIDLEPIIKTSDFTPAYEALTKSVMESPFGGMLAMFGGEAALEKLKEPFISKLKSSLITITKSESFNQSLQNSLQSSNLSEDLLQKIELVVNRRLDELTPKMVKEIVQNFIKEHLGWLIVWGGVFGGVIGAISAFLV